jgi:UDP-glucose 4-epimerase
MKILITGSAGFVGQHLVKEFSGKHEVVNYDLVDGQDVLDSTLLIKKLRGVGLIIHLAAFISAQESWQKPMDYMRNNALGTLSVINCAIKAGVKKVIFFSSAAVKAKPLTPYAVSKISAEEIVKLYSNKINIVVVRPENIYGLGQKANYGYVIHSFIKAVKNGENIKIYGTGNQTRDFIYIGDVVKVAEELIDLEIKSGSIISLGTGKQTEILALAKLVMAVMNKKTGIVFAKKRAEPIKSVADTRKLSTLEINVKKFVDLKTGIMKLL